MPIKRVTLAAARKPGDLKDDLTARLVDEWKEKGSIEPLPVIREEADGSGNVVHVYVVWKEWTELDHNARSEVITDAFWEVFGEKGLALTVAMGLTPEEAERMGLD